MKLVIDTCGDVHGVYSDNLANLGLGPLKVERASSVEFDDQTQCWQAKLRNGKVLSSPRREQVVAQEILVVEEDLIAKLAG